MKRLLAQFLPPTIALILGLGLVSIPLDSLEFFFYDLRVQTKLYHTFSHDIELILTNNDSLEKYKHIPGLTEHIDLLEALSRSKPAAVVYVTKIDQLAGSEADKNRFVTLAHKFKNFYQLTDELATKFEPNKLKMNEPFSSIAVQSGPLTADKSILAKDKTSRRMIITYQTQRTLHPILAEIFNPEISNKKNIRGLFTLFDSEQVYIDFHKKGGFSTTSLEQITRRENDPHQFDNKIVIIGDDLKLNFDDYARTPFSKDPLAMNRAELNANMFETLIQNSAPIQSPKWLDVLLTLVISFLSVYVVLIIKPAKGILVLSTVTLSFIAISLIAFWTLGFWISMAHPFLAVFVSYYFFIPYRLIMENKKSWEYFQKNKILSEVEELKTNFIGMMSHDLKTPLARIQGMTDVMVKDKVALSTQQREAIDTIRQSSEDLLKFISTILNYAKIESDGVELHMQSRDVNQLLNEVIKKYEFHAKLKHIQIIAEFETLFSIPVDPELIKQVFSNLLENAIKYSPEKSKVLISTEESNGSVIIQFADQGVGIPPDEVSNIFMKFFRSKQAKSSPIKGSGLGLYLAKYFIELHKGRITCESTVGAGSTFSVELPISK